MIWKFIQEKLTQGNNVMLMIVSETIGSSPGKVGFKMAVASDGSINGSIGGGVMEYQMVELAREKIKENIQKPFLKRQVHEHDAPEDRSGMICSGEQTNVFIPITSSHLNIINQIVEFLSLGNRGIVCVYEDGFDFKEVNPSKPLLPYSFEKGTDTWRYKELLGYKETVYIFGAGHISVPLSQILSLLDFRVEVFDNRSELSTYDANTYAHHKSIVDYKDVAKLVAEGPNSYVAIMTFGHKFDEIVLRQFLPKNLKYLGMIGSKGKVKTIFEGLVQEGFTQEQVNRVCSPIGLTIGGQTPAEIAVSIAAQIVQYRYKQ